MIYAAALTLTAGCGQNADNGQDHAHETENASLQAEHDHDDAATELDHDQEADSDGHEVELDHAHETESAGHEAESEDTDDDHAEPETGEHDHAAEPESALHDHAAEGDAIAAGADWETLINLETAQANLMQLNETLNVPGKIIPVPDAQAMLSPFIEASVNAVFGVVGDRVRAGDVLACLTSPEIGMMRAELDKAEAELEIQQKIVARQRTLFEEDVIPRRNIDEAELSLRQAEVASVYAVSRLKAVGVTDEEIAGGLTCKHGLAGSSVHLRAPIGGVIVSRDVRMGQKVNPATAMFEIIDLGTVWVEADIFETDLGKAAMKSAVEIRVSAYNDVFSGTVIAIGNTLDEKTRTIKVIAEIPNRDGRLKPGMFATADIVTGEKANALVVPREAVLEDESLHVVYVREEDGYHRHVVETGIVSGNYIEITGGLGVGDVVVTTGNFQLKSQSSMGAIDPHAGHNH